MHIKSPRLWTFTKGGKVFKEKKSISLGIALLMQDSCPTDDWDRGAFKLGQFTDLQDSFEVS